MCQLHKDKDIKVVSVLVNYKVDSMCEEWGGDKLVEHIDGTDKRIDRISEELSARTKILATYLLSHNDPTDNDTEALRNQITEFKV
jgi:hypothetical protein